VRFVPRIEAGAMMPRAPPAFNNLEWQSTDGDLAVGMRNQSRFPAEKSRILRLF
jgi:hypothetical protein